MAAKQDGQSAFFYSGGPNSAVHSVGHSAVHPVGHLGVHLVGHTQEQKIPLDLDLDLNFYFKYTVIYTVNVLQGFVVVTNVAPGKI